MVTSTRRNGFLATRKAIVDFDLGYSIYKDEPTHVYPFKRSSKKLFLVPLAEEAAKQTPPLHIKELPSQTQEILHAILNPTVELMETNDK